MRCVGTGVREKVCLFVKLCVLTSDGAVAILEAESRSSVRPSAEKRIPLEHCSKRRREGRLIERRSRRSDVHRRDARALAD